MTKTIPKKKKCKKTKWLPEESLQIAEKRREMKSKGERKRHTQLNAEYQKTARRVRKAFLSEQCQEIEGNNRMGNIRDLLKKIGDIKETFHVRMGMIKERNRKDVTEAEEIKRGGKNTQKNYTKKDLNNPDNHDDVVTHLKPDIPGCEIKWVLGSFWRGWNSN